MRHTSIDYMQERTELDVLSGHITTRRYRRRRGRWQVGRRGGLHVSVELLASSVPAAELLVHGAAAARVHASPGLCGVRVHGRRPRDPRVQTPVLLAPLELLGRAIAPARRCRRS